MLSISQQRSIGNQTIGLGAWIALCFTAAGVGSVAVSQSVNTWYQAINKPAWNPPNWLFAPVWSTLYLLMAISAWMVWRHRDTEPAKVRQAIVLFLIQLGLNTIWSWIFFAWRLPGTAFVEIVILWLAITATVVANWPVSRIAAALLVPYLGWVTFASILNGMIWRLN